MLNIEEAKTYIQRIRYLVIQFCVVLVILGVIGIIMIGATHDYDYNNSSENKVFTIFYGFKTVSSIVSLLGLLRIVWYVKRIPEMEKFGFFHKVLILKLGFLFTEVQPLIIELIASLDGIASTNIYSTAEITSYTNALLIVTEMIIISFLLYIEFPITDYDLHPEVRGKIEREMKSDLQILAYNNNYQ